MQLDAGPTVEELSPCREVGGYGSRTRSADFAGRRSQPWFKRWNDAGDVLLIVVNAGDRQWSNTQYAVSLAGDTGSWQEIFNSQAPLYGGINTVGNPGYVLNATNGQLWINLASWSVHIFAKG